MFGLAEKTIGAITEPDTGQSGYRSASRWALGLTLLFIAYQTTLPFDFEFSHQQLLAGWERATRVPFAPVEGYAASRSDIIGNILLFLPLGFFLTLCPLWACARRWRPIALAATGCALSLLIETAQLYSPLRYAQTTDLVTNTLGTAAGIVLAFSGGRDLWDASLRWALRTLREDPAVLVVVALTASILLGALLPLDLSISRLSLQNHWRSAELSLFGWPETGRLAAMIALIKQAWLFAFWGAAVAFWTPAGRRTWLLAGLGGAVLAVVAEASQMFVVSRTVSVTEPTVAWAGGLAGALAVVWGRRLGLSGRALTIGLGTGYIIYLVCDSISPLAPTFYRSLLEGKLPDPSLWRFQLVPFGNPEELPKLVALGDWVARGVRFIPLGLVLRLGIAHPGRRWALAGGAAGILLLFEVIVSRFNPWYGGDITEVILAWVGIAGGWWTGSRIFDYLDLRGQSRKKLPQPARQEVAP